MLHGTHSVSVTYPLGVPRLTVDVPEDMDIDERFAVLREVVARHKSIIADDRAMRGLDKKGTSLSGLLARRVRK